jgi:hypothetical protein
MKRITSVLFAVSMLVVGSNDVALSQYYSFDDNFGELNVKVGSQFLGKMDVNYKNAGPDDKNGTRDSDIGFIVTGEFLIPFRHFLDDMNSLQFGAGLSYSFPRRINTASSTYSYSYLPVYFTLQVNPFINSFEEYLNGIFVKVNIGYNVLSDFKMEDSTNYKFDNTRGIYYGFFAGYEFQFGLIFDLGYNVYKSESEFYDVVGDVTGTKKSMNLTCTNVTFSVGYKFKI